jgi:hypothetical protein
MSTERIDVEALRGHTPGPWDCYVDGPTVEPNWHIVTSANRMRVLANVHIDPGSPLDAINASLIQSAPSLLAEVIERRARDAELIADLRQAIDDVKIVRRVDGDGMEFGSIRKLANVERSLAAALAAIQGAQP